MFYKNVFIYSIIIILTSIDCQSSHYWNNEPELTNRKNPKKVYEFSLLNTDETEAEKKYTSCEGMEKYILYCKEKNRSCNVTEIYNDLKSASGEPLTYDLHANLYKKHIKIKFHIPDHLVSSLYQDLVNQIKEEIKK